MRKPYALPALLSACLPAAGCAEAGAPTPDERLATLPADATLVLALDAPSLARSPEVAAVLAAAGLPPVARLLLDDPAALRPDELRLGCGSEGCLALLDGDFRGADAALEGLVAHPPPGLQVRRAGGRLSGLDLDTEGGDELVLRVLADDKAVIGERAAVQAAWDRQGAGGLDPAAIAAAAPGTSSWVLLREPERLDAQLGARLEPASAEAWRARAARLRARVPELAGVQSLALGLGDPGLAARATCVDEATAAALARRAGREAPGLVVRRQGRVVDVGPLGPFVGAEAP